MAAPPNIARYRDWYAASGISEAMSSLPDAVRSSIVDARMVRGDQALAACSAVARRARAAMAVLGEFDATPAHTTMDPGDPAIDRPEDKALTCAEEARMSCEAAQAALGELHGQLEASFDMMGGVHNEHIGEALASAAMLEADLASARTMLASAMRGK